MFDRKTIILWTDVRDDGIFLLSLGLSIFESLNSDREAQMYVHRDGSPTRGCVNSVNVAKKKIM